MSPRICKALGYAVAWLVVGIVASLFGLHLFGTVFTTLFVLFGCMALVEGKGATLFDGRFAASKWQSMGVELVAAIAIYLPVILVLSTLFGSFSSASVGFLPLLASCFVGGILAPFTGKFLEGLTSGSGR